MATQADAAHEVGFDDRRPVLITDFLEGLWFVMAEVVNQNVQVGESTSGLLRCFRLAEIADKRPTFARGCFRKTFARAAATRSSERPFMITVAPSPARAEQMAKPMPAVEPVTKASLPVSCKSMVPPN